MHKYSPGIPYVWRSPTGIMEYWANSVALRALPIPGGLSQRERDTKRFVAVCQMPKFRVPLEGFIGVVKGYIRICRDI